MVNVLWLSANKFGFDLLLEAIKIPGFNIRAIITLSADSRTRMYDGIDPSKWHCFRIPVHEIQDINKELNLVRSYTPDLIVMCGWRQVLQQEILNLPKRGIIGFHPTLLPRGRGPAPIINTILEGIDESGVTMYYVSEGLDDGDIIGQVTFSVGPDDYASDIYRKVTRSGKRLVKTYFPMIVQKTAPRIPQDDRQTTCFPKRTIADNEIHPDIDSAETIYRKIRAFSNPYQGAFIIKDNKKLIIWKAEIRE